MNGQQLKNWKYLGIAVATVAIFPTIQLVPYGRNHVNPAVLNEPKWDTPRTREIFFRACKNCHSNETAWPWYSKVAPVSWVIQHDVNEGRETFNISEWGRVQNKGMIAADEVRSGEMPPRAYRLMNPEARLTSTEREELADGLEKTFNPQTDQKPKADGKIAI